jgi:mevalonate kinase
VDLRTFGIVEYSDSVELHLLDFNFCAKWSLDGQLESPNGGVSLNVQRALQAFTQIYQMQGISVGITVKIKSQIPVGSGLGSSASYAVCIATLVLLASNAISPQLTADDLVKINDLAFTAERVMHANPSGVDNSISTYGGFKIFQRTQPLVSIDGYCC